MRLDTLIGLMIDWPDGEIALQLLERLLHFGELDVEGPQLRRGLSYEIGAQQIPAFVPPAGAQARPVQRKGESLRGDGLTGLGQFDVTSPAARPASFWAPPILSSSWSRDGACLRNS